MLDHVNTVGKATQSQAFCSGYGYQQRRPIHELDVVVLLCPLIRILTGRDILDRVDGSRRVKPLRVPKPCLG